MAKYTVVNKRGAKVRMNDAALRIAERHFGVNRSRPTTKEVPVELLKLPTKIEIIKAQPIPPPIAKAPVIEIVKPEVPEVKAEIKPEVKKRTAPKRRANK